MKKYIIQRLLRSIVTVFVVVFLVFMMLRMMPTSGYFTRDDFLTMTEEMRTTYLKNLGVLDPPLEQFKNFILNTFRGDLGKSITVYPKVDIAEILPEKMMYSAIFGLCSMLVSMITGMSMGLLMARKKDGLADHVGTGYAVLIRSIPSLIYLFLIQILVSRAFKLPMLFYPDRPASWILPILSLSLSSIAWYAIWLRRFLVDEENRDYIKFARAKGFSEKYIMRRHVLRNALLPIAIGIPSDLLLIISGSLIIENLYSIPGMGGLLINAIRQMDNNLVQILVLIYAVLSVLGVFLGDLLVVLIDPRIRLSDDAV
ncbi:MAG: ABC transporter permease [Bacillota bacterium]|nr:ABC transporter permease [Bacillota bacterium]